MPLIFMPYAFMISMLPLPMPRVVPRGVAILFFAQDFFKGYPGVIHISCDCRIISIIVIISISGHLINTRP